MKKEAVNYETLRLICDTVSASKKLDDVSQSLVKSLTEALEVKGCALMLWDRRANELVVTASKGLSEEYLDKGPVSAIKSIGKSLHEGPVGIYDVEDDPRLQYPEEASKEGIKSIMSVPMVLRGRPIGVLRVYTDEPWTFQEIDIVFMQAVAEIAALVIDNLRLYRGLKSSIEVLKLMQSGAELGETTPFDEGRPWQ
ncbi:MAG: GAF domain-containing protein, partial [Proteobacteria bacterium]|nr:GAF domain-containing protein [Pseudomonadota bacterium]